MELTVKSAGALCPLQDQPLDIIRQRIRRIGIDIQTADQAAGAAALNGCAALGDGGKREVRICSISHETARLAGGVILGEGGGGGDIGKGETEGALWCCLYLQLCAGQHFAHQAACVAAGGGHRGEGEGCNVGGQIHSQFRTGLHRPCQTACVAAGCIHGGNTFDAGNGEIGAGFHGSAQISAFDDRFCSIDVVRNGQRYQAIRFRGTQQGKQVQRSAPFVGQDDTPVFGSCSAVVVGDNGSQYGIGSRVLSGRIRNHRGVPNQRHFRQCRAVGNGVEERAVEQNFDDVGVFRSPHDGALKGILGAAKPQKRIGFGFISWVFVRLR